MTWHSEPDGMLYADAPGCSVWLSERRPGQWAWHAYGRPGGYAPTLEAAQLACEAAAWCPIQRDPVPSGTTASLYHGSRGRMRRAG